MAKKAYAPLAQIELTGETNKIYFTNIDQSYQDLLITINIIQNSAASPLMRFNSDSANNYGLQNIVGSTTSTTEYSVTSTNLIQLNYGLTASTQQISMIEIFNYSEVDKYKSVLSRWGAHNQGNMIQTSIWRNLNPIYEIEFSANEFQAGTTVGLWGISA